MPDKYLLWKVSYSYPVPSDIAGEMGSNDYLIVAKNPAEAERKADDFFVKESFNADSLKRDLVKKSIRVYKKKTSLPKLTLKSDQNRFSLEAEVSNDGSSFTIDFVVDE